MLRGGEERNGPPAPPHGSKLIVLLVNLFLRRLAMGSYRSSRHG